MAVKEATTPRWQELKFPSEERFIEVAERYPDLDGIVFHELPGWIRLGWPDEALWHLCARTDERARAKERKEREPQPWPVCRRPWAEVLAKYPVAKELRDDEQDVYRILRFWPDCFGQAIVEVDLKLAAGITINGLTYSAGKLRVPASVATDLRWTDGKARQDFLDQFIPKKHQDKVIATLSMAGSAAAGEITQ